MKKTYYFIYDREEETLSCVTLKEILKEINRDRSAGWRNYNKTDWKEGVSEWVSHWKVLKKVIATKRPFRMFSLDQDIL